ncbi:MAG TPA: antibiotic biosynthesis monooxygenase [Mycobacteriales bacterium]|nr:antibiotic biosynthesis monooxygenase [Mycobacteriales bacterium]
MLVVTRFDVAPDGAQAFLDSAAAALQAFAERPGFLRGKVGRAADDPALWVLSTEWDGVGSYRRSLGAFEVKVHAAPLLAQGRDEPSAFELLREVEGGAASASASRRARDADVVGLGEASGPASSDL